MRIVRAADYRIMPWKNGGGTTTEIAVSPEGAGLDDFDWRVSMARVERSGPFSSFPGVDRTLSILEGEGIFLHVDGRIPIGLTRASDPLSFPADLPTRAGLIAGPIVDLNVMARRIGTAHSVERLTIAGDGELACDADATLVFCHGGRIRVGGTETVLESRDTLCAGRKASALRLASDGPATLFVIRFGAA